MDVTFVKGLLKQATDAGLQEAINMVEGALPDTHEHYGVFMSIKSDHNDYKDDLLHNRTPRNRRPDLITRMYGLLNLIGNPNIDSIASIDHHYEILCKFDFEKQAEYFEALVNSSKTVVPLIIKGDGQRGQDWLYNKFIYEFTQKRHNNHPPIVINLEELGNGFRSFLYFLKEKLILDRSYDGKPVDDKIALIIKAISQKLRTSSQIIVIKNAYLLVESDEFYSLWNFLNELNNEVTQILNNLTGDKTKCKNNKCILFFVEYSKEYNNKDECIVSSEKMTAYQVQQHATFSMVDLHPISNITLNTFHSWFTTHPRHECWNCWGDEMIIQHMENCDNGNPLKVIHFICEQQNINYQEKETLWLKY